MLNSALWYRQFGIPKNVLQLETFSINVNNLSECLVEMIAAPINPSDLLPITGTYSHRVTPPLVAGYEGVGIIIDAREPSLIGKRVLPIRSEGTWQNYVSCNPKWLIPVPDNIGDELAARGYINPLAAYLILKQRDILNKNIIVTAAGSSCANILAQWAQILGAKRIIGVYRSNKHIKTLEDIGVVPVSMLDHKAIINYSSDTDYVFDSVGGDLATLLLASLNGNCQFISYGLLSGKLYQINLNGVIPVRFHIRDYLPTMTEIEWQNSFSELWNLLVVTKLPKVQHFDLVEWQQALTYFEVSGRNAKPLLIMAS